MIGEFISTLAMALKCYPLQPGGLLALQAIALGLTTPDAVYREVRNNFPVILLLMLMVADIYFMKDRRRPHHGGRAAEPIDCREDGLGVQRIFRACGAGVTAGADADS